MAAAIILFGLHQHALAEGWVGAYVWGGVITKSAGVQRFYDTIFAVLDAGFDTVRIAPGPNAIDEVTLAPSCVKDDTLACYARLLLASDVWDHPKLRRVMLTAIDRTCQTNGRSNDGCLISSLLLANKDRIKAEYAALFNVIRDRFAGRNIQVILSNWEGDNFVYCGSAFDFGKNAKEVFPERCRAAWPGAQTNLERVQAHLLWHRLRDEAVSEFTAANPGLDLISAPEINSLVLFEPGCGGLCNPSTDKIVDQIAATGGRKHCSYSSYDTQGLSSRGGLVAAVKRLLSVCGNVIIGEAGYDLLRPGNLRRSIELFETLDRVRRLRGVLGVVIWNAVDPADGSSKYGLFDASGAPQLLQHLGPLARP